MTATHACDRPLSGFVEVNVIISVPPNGSRAAAGVPPPEQPATVELGEEALDITLRVGCLDPVLLDEEGSELVAGRASCERLPQQTTGRVDPQVPLRVDVERDDVVVDGA